MNQEVIPCYEKITVEFLRKLKINRIYRIYLNYNITTSRKCNKRIP